MKHIKYFITLLMLLTGLGSRAQKSGDYFYYYRGDKFYLQADPQTIALSVENNNAEDYVRSLFTVSGDLLSPVKEDHARSTVSIIDQQALNRREIKTWYIELTSSGGRSMEEYPAALAAYGNLSSVIMASPCFKNNNGMTMGLSNNFYVKLKDRNDVDRLYAEAEKMNVEVLGHNRYMPLWFTLSCSRITKMNALQAANLFYETGLFDASEPAFVYHSLLATNDTYYGNQWGLLNTGQWGASGTGIDIHAEDAWNITTGSSSIHIAIFDEGIELNHPDLVNNIAGTGYDAETGTTPSVVRGDHGTACAGIAAAQQNNNLGVSGVAPDSRLISVSLDFTFFNTPAQLADGFSWSWQNGADVISNSWGGYAPSSIIENSMTDALDFGRSGLGCVVVFASGNENNTHIRYPGRAIPRVLVVGAISPCGERKNPSSCDGENWWGSCYGTELDVMAPGVKMPTTDRQGGNGYDGSDYTQTFNGTSSACPGAAGVAALMLSVNPDLTEQQVTDIIERTAQKVRTDLYTYSTTSGYPNGTWNNEMGYGLVDAHQAVLAAQALACPTSLTISSTVVSPNTDKRQAASTITAQHTVGNGAVGLYHAGDAVMLNPGFYAEYGSGFRAYIEGCTGTYVYRHAGKEQIQYDFRAAKIPFVSAGNAQPGERLTTMPNPFGNRLVIGYRFGKGSSRADISVYSATGIKVSGFALAAKTPGSTEYMEWDTQGLQPGAYLLALSSGTDRFVKKLIKQ